MLLHPTGQRLRTDRTSNSVALEEPQDLSPKRETIIAVSSRCQARAGAFGLVREPFDQKNNAGHCSTENHNTQED